MMATAAPMNLALLFGAELGSRHTSCVTRQIHVIGIGAGDPDYVTAQAVAALNDTQVFFAMDKGEAQGRPGGVAADRSANGSSASLAIDSSNWPTRRAPRTATTGRPSPTGTRRGRAVWAASHRVRTRARRCRRLPGVGRPVAVRQHAADPRLGAPPTSTSTTTSSPASPPSRRSPRDIASRSTTSANRC